MPHAHPILAAHPPQLGMTRSEFYFRKAVCALARPIPLASPYWTGAMVFVPALLGICVIRGSSRSLRENTIVSTFLSDRGVQILEGALLIVMLFVSVSFLARLLQICDPRYFDRYRIEEEN